ncbi:MAG: hypothetical protein IT384_04265 [Deltaproteobacteria bacterium]|nr:hypothetical protein [Deltaproteobacteria bacterium]
MNKGWAETNARKAWKWVYLVLKQHHESSGLLVVPLLAGNEQRFAFIQPSACRDRWAVYGVFSVGARGARFEKTDSVIELAGFSEREIRTEEGLAWLLRAIHVNPLGSDEDEAVRTFRTQARLVAADYLKTWNLIGQYAAMTGATATTTSSLSQDALMLAPRTSPLAFRLGDLTVLSTGIVMNNAMVAIDVDEDFGRPKAVDALLFSTERLTANDVRALGREPGPLLAEIDVECSSLCFAPDSEVDLAFGSVRGGLAWLSLGAPLRDIAGSETCRRVTFWGAGGDAWLLSPDGLAWRSPALHLPERLPASFGGQFAHAASPWVSPLAGSRSTLWRVVEGRIQCLFGSPEEVGTSWAALEERFVDVGVGGATNLIVDANGCAALISPGAEHVVAKPGAVTHEIRDTPIPGGHPVGGALSSIAGLLAIFSREIQLLDLDDNACVADLRIRSQEKVSGAFTPDGRYLVFVTSGLLLAMKPSSRTCRILGPVQTSGYPTLVAFSPRGTRLAVAGARLRVFDWPALLERWAIAPSVPLCDGLLQSLGG